MAAPLTQLLDDQEALDSALNADSKPVAVAATRSPRLRLLLSAYVVLFIRYVIATILSGYFTPVAQDNGINGNLNGLIFAAYPLGMALTSVVAAQVVQRVGTKNGVSIGLVLTVVCNLAFGYAPEIAGVELGQTPPQQSGGRLALWSFAFYFFNGLTGALAETSCIMLVANKYKDNLGKVMASIGTVCGLGCMLGPVVGGVLYDTVPRDDPSLAFKMPSYVTSALVVALLPVLRYTVPQVRRRDAWRSLTAVVRR